MATTKSIGGTIRRLRVAAGMTQADLATRADTSVEGVSRIERGRISPGPGLLARLATALGTSPEAIRSGTTRAGAAKVRAGVAKLVAMTNEMSDAQVDDVVKAVRLMIGIGRQLGPEKKRGRG